MASTKTLPDVRMANQVHFAFQHPSLTRSCLELCVERILISEPGFEGMNALINWM
jgi:hypothetical protein